MPVRRILSDLHPLTWNNHIENLVLLYIQLKRAGASQADIARSYCIRTYEDYACNRVSARYYLREYLYRTYPNESTEVHFPRNSVLYSALELAKIHFIDEHHDMLTKKQFKATYCS